MDKIFEINFQFRLKWYNFEKGSLSNFKSFFTGIDKVFILGGRLSTRLSFQSVGYKKFLVLSCSAIRDVK